MFGLAPWVSFLEAWGVLGLGKEEFNRGFRQMDADFFDLEAVGHAFDFQAWFAEIQ